jgi:hypothetical protein
MSITKQQQIHQAAQALGRLGGLAKSKAKAKAVRENGKLGGRPLKSAKLSKQSTININTNIQ